MEPVSHTFGEFLLSLLHGVATVVMALAGIGFSPPPVPASFPAQRPAPAPDPAPRALPVEMRVGAEAFRPGAPVTFARQQTAFGPAILLQLAEADRAGLAAFTAAHVGEDAQLLVCGKVVMAPRILEPVNVPALTLSGPEVTDLLGGFMRSGCP